MKLTELTDRRVVTVACALVALDVFFVIVHGVKFAFKEEFIDLFGYWLYRNLTITNDWAIPEAVNYLKFVVIVALLARVYRSVRQPVYLAWAIVYAVALIDDSMQIHERLGECIAGGIPGGEGADQALRPQDLGELVVYAIYAGALSGVVGIGFMRSSGEHRKWALGFVALLLALAFFVGVVDMIDRMALAYGRTLAQVLATFEDSGEMVVVSLTVAYALFVRRRLA